MAQVYISDLYKKQIEAAIKRQYKNGLDILVAFKKLEDELDKKYSKSKKKLARNYKRV